MDDLVAAHALAPSVLVDGRHPDAPTPFASTAVLHYRNDRATAQNPAKRLIEKLDPIYNLKYSKSLRAPNASVARRQDWTYDH
ncbi:hypothetical protein [Ensifer sp. SSB1]|jgi:hypothetical protein|uniref:hypothetical protein n=1 Tax=Ensifer sp. SSB1 TaxID=2795385 RepID=UPI001A51F3A3|nr:hypothetical protein [Ensifer sp. SSB1]MBK5566183.1 hypothetical protein [Ensifer sp. SSB1]